ncbi:MAG: hypothetical protein ACKOOF_03565 [Planctomycetaceae bacterium]
MTVVLIPLLACVGCADKRTADLVPVTGLVRRNGRPLTHGIVVFVPAPPLQAPLAFGNIGPEGRYAMRAANKYVGVRPGPYTVVIDALEPAANPPPEAGTPIDPFLRPSAAADAVHSTTHENTPYRCDVPAGGTTFDIDLPVRRPTDRP